MTRSEWEGWGIWKGKEKWWKEGNGKRKEKEGRRKRNGIGKVQRKGKKEGDREGMGPMTRLMEMGLRDK